MAVVRFDTGELSKPVKQPNGWLRADGFITRVGVFTYRKADGSTIREYRPPEEVFKQDSLESFAFVPLTNDHPADGLLDAENTHKYQVGTVVAPRADGAFVRSQFLVTHADAITALEAGKTQLSGGYVCDLDETPGTTPEGERYDAIQRNIRGNHVAIVAVGRAGPQVRLRMDSAEQLDSPARSVHSATNEPIRKESGKEKTVILKLDGVEVDLPETAAQLVQKTLKAHEDKATALKSDLDKATAKADGLQADLEKAQTELKGAPAKALAAAKARAELEATASKILGEEKLDGLSDAEIKAKVLGQEMPKIKLDGKSADYVDALFDKVVADFQDEGEEREDAETAPIADARADSVDAAQRKYFEALNKVQPH